MLNTTLTTLTALSIYLGVLYFAATPYKCHPVQPKEDCKLSRYEVRVHDITHREKNIIAVAEGACVFTVGDGRDKRIVMTDAEFHAKGRTDYFDRVEFPAAQSIVCEVR